ncbi:DUF885 domain-containing protein [Archangium lansingense]|uniref:DUF885 domain-containing protein n=1 Tax=Archangium lansingense TaxID=2995310 RepID=A0ABT3ZWP7_9BACT|nr:DUF885 domain-containing protein [Archangium lansinium]MCY1073489.1 DUF885 domain-containing protein [Archangium lansinium]
MNRASLLFVLLVVPACATAPASVPAASPEAPAPSASAPAPSEDARLAALLEEDWQWRLRENPLFATAIGDSRYDDRLTDLSFEAIDRREQHALDVRRQLQGIDPARLSESSRLDYQLFLRELEESIEGQRFPTEYLQLSQLGGPHTLLPELALSMPRATVKNHEDFLQRMKLLPVYVEQSIALMRKGAEAGITPPRVTLREVAGLLQKQLVDDPTKSPIYLNAFASFPASIPPEDQARLREQAIVALRESVLPAYRELHRFFVSEYLPRTRETIGLSAVPEGAAWYAWNVRRLTTTDLSPEQIHELGLSEVARIRAEMEQVKAQAGFKGNLPAFFHFLRTDPRFFFDSRDALLVAYRDISKRIDPELPRLFGRLPRLPYGVFPVPEYSEKTQTTAYYMRGSQAAGRAGRYYANTYDLKSRPKWEMEALSLHEAVPGHHLQISLMQELEALPAFRRYGGYTAFVEGWGLYAESLGSELGLYRDPYARFGQLTYEMWRAVRLVVDTGMHAKRWTREQAIQFFKDNASKTEHDITVEVDRYLVWPGQALAYKLGELKLKELRALATQELGPRFDVRAFHDEVLGQGALPLSFLEARVKSWVERQKATVSGPVR